MKEKYFYDIPVYRISRERYYDDMEEYIKKKMYSGNARHKKLMESFHQKYPEQKNAAEKILRESYGGSWEFNEIIGYIRLYFFGNQVRGEYWTVNSKRVIRTRKKTLEYKTWKLAPEIDLHWEKDSQSIFSRILEYLDRCQNELKGRYVDISNFKTIGPYVDWKLLYDESIDV